MLNLPPNHKLWIIFHVLLILSFLLDFLMPTQHP
jgi:uncharacterized membrane protein